MDARGQSQRTSGYTSVADSFVGVILVRLANRIEDIQRRYAAIPDKSPERLYSDKLLAVIKQCIEIADKKFLANFDNGNIKPGFPSMLWEAWSQRNIAEGLEAAEYLLVERICKLMTVIHKEAQRVKLSPSHLSGFITKYLSANQAKLCSDLVNTPGRDMDSFFAVILKTIKDKNFFLDAKQIADDKEHLLDVLQDQADIFSKGAYFSHRMQFELAIEVIKLFHEAPAEAREALSFFNPDSLNIDLSEGVFAWFLGKFTSHRGKLEHLGDLVYDYTDYRYLRSGKVRAIKSTHSVNGYYRGFFLYAYSVVLAGIHGYVTYSNDPLAVKLYENLMQEIVQYYADQSRPFVQSDVCQTKFLRKFIDLESSQIKNGVNHCLRRSVSDEFICSLSGDELASVLSNQIEIEKIKCQYQLYFQQRLTYYKTKTLSSLMSAHAGFMKYQNDYKEKNVDLSFLRAPIPLCVINVRGKKATIRPVLVNLEKKIKEQLQRLNYDADRMKRLTEWSIRPDTIPRKSEVTLINHEDDVHAEGNNKPPATMLTLEDQYIELIKLIESLNRELYEECAQLNQLNHQLVLQENDKVVASLKVQLSDQLIKLLTVMCYDENDQASMIHDFINKENCFIEWYEAQVNLYQEIANIQADLKALTASVERATSKSFVKSFSHLFVKNNQQALMVAEWQSAIQKKNADLLSAKNKVKNPEAFGSLVSFSSVSDIYDSINDFNVKKVEVAKTIAVKSQLIADLRVQLKESQAKLIAIDNRFSRQALIKEVLTKLQRFDAYLDMDEIKHRLAGYEHSDHAEQLICFFTDLNQSVTDIYFNTVVNKVIVSIVDHDRTVNGKSHYVEARHGELYRAIDELQQSAKSLKKSYPEDAKIIKQLSAKLRQDLDYFLIIQKGSPEAHQHFLRVFHARLHSEDILLQKHASLLSNIVLNIALLALTILSAGLIAGARLLYTKATTGCFAFFVSRSINEQLTVIESLKPAPAA